MCTEVSRMPLRTLGGSRVTSYTRVFAHQARRIMSGTIKDNILFSHEYDETFYNLVLDGERHHLAKRFPSSHPTLSLRTQTGLSPSF